MKKKNGPGESDADRFAPTLRLALEHRFAIVREAVDLLREMLDRALLDREVYPAPRVLPAQPVQLRLRFLDLRLDVLSLCDDQLSFRPVDVPRQLLQVLVLRRHLFHQRIDRRGEGYIQSILIALRARVPAASECDAHFGEHPLRLRHFLLEQLVLGVEVVLNAIFQRRVLRALRLERDKELVQVRFEGVLPALMAVVPVVLFVAPMELLVRRLAVRLLLALGRCCCRRRRCRRCSGLFRRVRCSLRGSLLFRKRCCRRLRRCCSLLLRKLRGLLRLGRPFLLAGCVRTLLEEREELLVA